MPLSVNHVVDRPVSTHFEVDLPAGSVRDVYETLRQLAIRESICRENLDVLVRKSGYCQRTVQRSLRMLEKLGRIRVKRYFNKYNRLSNAYYLVPLQACNARNLPNSTLEALSNHA